MKMQPLICLMGPTAAGKTALAIELTQRLPCDIVSVDSAMVYRGMDIGTAKPSQAELTLAPHRLIDCVDPADAYSAGRFREDALREIAAITARGRIPLLVGGTMLYFRVLQQGIAPLPSANASLRATLSAQGESAGWATLHALLARHDPKAAARIHPADKQRIQRALEVYQLSGKTISAWQSEDTNPLANYRVYNLAIAPQDRAVLHARIAARFSQMLAAGFIDEVTHFYQRGDLDATLPAMRTVGYRQIWSYLTGEIDRDTMHNQALAATRQLAKRQLTWLRRWPNCMWFDSESHQVVDQVLTQLRVSDAA